jgi:hypothetical protein
MIPVQITQTQEEQDNPTMAIPFVVNNLVAQIRVPELAQKILNFGIVAPTHELRPVLAHVRNKNSVREHMRKLRIRKDASKNESKTKNSKKKGKVKHGAFPKMRDDDGIDKGDIMLARSLHFKELSDLARGINN